LGRDVRRFVGSASVALDSTGSGLPTASQLYAPYGGLRYSNGVMPTDYGFTGQRNDATTGLYYYGARYYDPTIGQFTSTDTVLAGGLNRYGYVGDNPINRTDPSGHRTAGADLSGAPPLGDGNSIENMQRFGTNDGPNGGGGGGASLGLGELIAITIGAAYLLVTPAHYAQLPQQSAASSTTSGPDELTRAWAHFGADPDYWNARTAPHSTPRASASGGSGGGGHGGGGGSGTSADTPQTQTDGGSAGGTFGGGGGAAPASPEDDSCGCWFTKLYRAIRPDEDISKGLFPRNPGRNMSPAGHVRNGSHPNFKGSQFISTSLFPEFAAKYGSNIVEIDVSLIQGQILDVSGGGMEYGFYPGSRAYDQAMADQEVLIDGWVPPEAIRQWQPETPGC
jgi:RHS repeat-associated protein